MLGKIEGKKRSGQQRMRWLDIIDTMDMSLSKIWEIVKDSEDWNAADDGAAEFRQSLVPEQQHLGSEQKAKESVVTTWRQHVYLKNNIMCVLSHVWLFATLWTIAHQASLIHGISQSRILEWVAISYSRGSSQPRDQTCVSCISCTGRQILYY